MSKEDTSIYEELSEERKEFQSKGKIPEWMTTIGWQMFKSKYLYEAEALNDTYQRIASHLASFTNTPLKWSEIFYEMLWKGWLACSTPVLANCGTTRGCPVSCSGSVIGDSIYDFFEAQKELAILSKNGFGTSCYMGNIRPRGSKRTGGGKAQGILPEFKRCVQIARDISQGDTRVGSWAGYIDIDHDDFWEVTDYALNDMNDTNLGYNIPDSFIEKLQKGDNESIARYQRAMKARMLGKGYFYMIDKTHRQQPKMYHDKGLKSIASNLCVVPETKILTDKGYFEIKDLENQEVNIWNGEEFSKSLVKKTGTNQKILKVKTINGLDLECTEYHKFYILENYKKIKEVRAKDLKPGDKLLKFDTPIIEGIKNLENSYTNGFYNGDGCFDKRNNKCKIYLYDKKRNLKEFISNSSKWGNQDNQNRDYCYSENLKDKFFVPNSDYTIKSRLEWLEGLCDSDGTILYSKFNTESIQIGNTNLKFLEEVYLMLQTLGCNTKLTKMRDKGFRQMPANDGTGALKFYECNNNYKIIINCNDTYNLFKLGFNPKRLKLKGLKPKLKVDQYIKIESITNEGRISDTYCFNEPKRHMGVFNGILTGNCTEIVLHADMDHTFTCVLSSLNLSKYDEWKNTNTIFNSIVFLDCVAQSFIEKAKYIKGLERAVRFTEKSRALGLGTLGFHTYLQQKGIPFDSMDAYLFNTNIFKEIQEKTIKANVYLAKEYGEPEWCKGYGVRCTHLTAIAPNTSSALICGSVSQGIEPFYENVFSQGSAAGEMDRMNPILLKIMKERKKYNPDIIDRIIKNKGSVSQEDWLSNHEKDVFKTAFEIDQRFIIKMASTRQRYIDQAQSLNLFFNENESEQYISEIHEEAITDKYIKSLYYVRSKAGVNTSKNECVVCEG